ncbi:uncharacterized protein [Amphiura filiformis]|uniref:uncharacterized protein n=1 Tax=Amphiura filiformis TaxID=82378 RepID=UPI003B219FFF
MYISDVQSANNVVIPSGSFQGRLQFVHSEVQNDNARVHSAHGCVSAAGVTYLVLSVVSICLSVGQCILLSIATSVEWSWEYCATCINDVSRRETVDGLAAVVGFIELIAAFVAVGFCWWEICGQELRTREMLIDYPVPGRSGQLTVVTAGGYISGDHHTIGGGQKYAVQQPSGYPSHHQSLYTPDGKPYRSSEASF